MKGNAAGIDLTYIWRSEDGHWAIVKQTWSDGSPPSYGLLNDRHLFYALDAFDGRGDAVQAFIKALLPSLGLEQEELKR